MTKTLTAILTAAAVALSGCRSPQAPMDPRVIEVMAAARPEARGEAGALVAGWLDYQRHEAAMGAGSAQQISPPGRK